MAIPAAPRGPVSEPPRTPASATASFIVRLWLEPSRRGASEWRGTVARVGGEATLAFRTLEGLEPCLRRLLPEADED